MADLLDDLWFIVTGVGDGDDCVPEPGYEKSAHQRRDDCESVRELLGGGIDPNVRDNYGAHLLYLALEYDHRHDAEMVRVVVEAGADVNAETHSGASEWVLDSELWLETEGLHAVANARKRAYLISRGARHSPTAAAAAAEAATAAAAAERARDAAAKEAEAALERRLDAARRLPPEPSVPSWE
jgi:hypothetical protein